MDLSHLAQLLIIIPIIILASKAVGALAGKFGQPAVFGELLAGLILGPSVIDLLGFHIFDHKAVASSIKDLSEIGVILLMFLAGFETDLGEMKKVGFSAFCGAIGGVFLPFAGGTGLALAFGLGFTEAFFIGTILTATSVSISAQTLIELGKLRSKEGAAILGAAVIDDIIGIIMLSVVVALSSKSGSEGSISILLTKMIAFFIAAIGLSKFFPKILRYISKVKGSEMLLAGALAACFMFSFFAEYFGQVAAITGAYIAGVAIGQTEFRDTILHKLEVVAYSFFVPIFFASIGLESNIRLLGSSLSFTLLVIAVAILSKAVGAAFGVRLTGFSRPESLRVGAGMVSRGEVALIVSGIGLTKGIIGNDTFAAMVAMTLVTTLITPMLLRLSFKSGEAPYESSRDGR